MVNHKINTFGHLFVKTQISNMGTSFRKGSRQVPTIVTLAQRALVEAVTRHIESVQPAGHNINVKSKETGFSGLSQRK